jgi:hypothetical protein
MVAEMRVPLASECPVLLPGVPVAAGADAAAAGVPFAETSEHATSATSATSATANDPMEREFTTRHSARDV